LGLRKQVQRLNVRRIEGIKEIKRGKKGGIWKKIAGEKVQDFSKTEFKMY